MPIIPALWRQEDYEFEAVRELHSEFQASLQYIDRVYLKNLKTKQKKKGRKEGTKEGRKEGKGTHSAKSNFLRNMQS
jgi:hypothetical protein